MRKVVMTLKSNFRQKVNDKKFSVVPQIHASENSIKKSIHAWSRISEKTQSYLQENEAFFQWSHFKFFAVHSFL